MQILIAVTACQFLLRPASFPLPEALLSRWREKARDKARKHKDSTEDGIMGLDDAGLAKIMQFYKLGVAPV